MKVTRAFLLVSEKTKKARSFKAYSRRNKKGIIDVETNVVSGINNFKPGYLDTKQLLLVSNRCSIKRIVNLLWNENGRAIIELMDTS